MLELLLDLAQTVGIKRDGRMGMASIHAHWEAQSNGKTVAFTPDDAIDQLMQQLQDLLI